jgi:hypothetical protein
MASWEKAACKLEKKTFKGARKNNRCKDPANSNDFNITDYGILDDP